MANTLSKASGQASIAGTTLYTVGVDEAITLIGCRASNTDESSDHTVHFTINGVLICGYNTPLPTGSAIDVMAGSKVVAVEGDVVEAFSDAESVIDVYMSFLSQTPDAE